MAKEYEKRLKGLNAYAQDSWWYPKWNHCWFEDDSFDGDVEHFEIYAKSSSS